MEKDATALVDKGMYIQEILTKYPDKAKLISEILLEFGVGCSGCGASSYETLEQGVLGHGFSTDELDKLVFNLNRALTKSEIKKSAPARRFSLDLTDNAVKKIAELMKNNGKTNCYLRVGVLAGGCSGYSYNLNFVDQPSAKSLKLKKGEIDIEIDPQSLEILNGTEIDFIDTLQESGFKFYNPNASKECGCGRSFS